MKVINILKDRYLPKEKSSSDRLEKSKTRSAIESLCEKYLVHPDDVLMFEALPKALDNTIALIEETALTRKYVFTQVSETLFEVRLKELSIV